MSISGQQTAKSPTPVTSRDYFRILVPGLNADVDLVAIHGLNVLDKPRHAEATWTAENGRLWLRDLLPLAIPNARVLLFAYNSNVAFQNSTIGIYDASESLLDELLASRKDLSSRPIVFLAHSLGGLVVKRALVSAKLDAKYKSIYEATYGIGFFGTPHRGGNGASIGSITARIARCVLFNPKNTFMEALKKGSLSSAELARDFLKVCNRLHILSFYETLPMGSFGLVVDESSAILGLSSDREQAVAVATNHRQICKFGDLDDPQYLLVQKHVVSLAVNAVADAIETTTRPPDQVSSNVSSHYIELSCALPFGKNESFVGREIQLSLLENKLGMNGGNSRKAALFGLGGIGKSQVALEFAYRYANSHPSELLFWIYAGNEYQFRQSFLSIAERLDIPGCKDRDADVPRLTRDWLKMQTELRWLIIIDNADDEALFFGLGAAEQAHKVLNPGVAASRLIQYIPECPQGASLLTTRNKKVAVKFTKGRNLIELAGLETHESIELVSSLIDPGGSQKLDIMILLDRLDNIPLALAQATAYIQENTITVKQYLHLLYQGSQITSNLLSTEFEAPGRTNDVPNAVISTWIISFNQIRSRCPRAARVLSLIAFYDQQNIPDFLLLRKPRQAEDMCMQSHQKDANKSCWLSGVQHQQGAQDEGEEIDLEFSNACGTLKAFSLVRETTTPGFYEVHRLVRLAIRKWLRINGELEFAAATAINTIRYFFPSDCRLEDWSACAVYLPHALSAIAEAVALEVHYTDVFYALLLNVSKYMWHRWHTETSTLTRLGLEVAERLYDVDDPRTLRMRHRLASEQLSRGRLKEAEKLELQVLHSYAERLFDRTFLFSLVGLAEIQKGQGRLKYSEALLRCALDILKYHHLGQTDGGCKRIEITVDLSDVYRLEKCFDRAKLALQEAQSMLGSKPGSLFLQLKLEKCQAAMLQDQGDFEKAQFSFVSILSKQTSLLGSDHPEVLKTRTQIAILLKCQGLSSEAVQILTECCESLKNILGSQHPVTRQTYRVLERWQQNPELKHTDVLTAPEAEQPVEDEPDGFLHALEERIQRFCDQI